MCTKITGTTVSLKRLPCFVLRNIHNHYLIVPIKSHLDGHVLSTNDVGAFIWDVLENKSKLDDIVDRVVEKYGRQPTSEKDVLSCIDIFLDLGVVETI